MDIECHRVSATDLVITTTDTVRHSDILGTWLISLTPLILCGPPGSGKTMTLTKAHFGKRIDVQRRWVYLEGILW
jgi:dynein heavy chain 1, cytosolic